MSFQRYTICRRLFLSCFTSACPWRKVSSSVDGVSLNQLAGCGELLTHCSSYLTAALCCHSPQVLNLRQVVGSKALLVAALWMGIAHLLTAGLGTFILKRFPTTFAIGFFLGVVLILANQNLILFGTFHSYSYGNVSTNHAFGLAALMMAILLTVFSSLLYHYKHKLVMAPIDVKGLGSRKSTAEENSYRLEERPSA